MKALRVVPFGVVFLALAARPQAQKVLLRFGLVTGTPFHYVLRDTRAGRELLLNVTETVTDSSGVRTLSTHVDSALFLVPGRPPQSPGSIGDFTVRTDERRRWIDSVGGEDTILAGLRAAVLGRVVPLPEGPIGAGDSWKVEFPTRITYHQDPSYVATAKAKVKVKSVDFSASDTTVVLEFSLHLDGSQPPKQDWPEVDVTGDLKGQEAFSLHAGMTQHLKLGGRVEWSWSAMGPHGLLPHTFETEIDLVRDLAP